MTTVDIDNLCEQLDPVIFHPNTNFRKALTVEKRVAITLWCLATPCEYLTVAHLFGVAHSTVCTIVYSTCQAIVNSLLRKYVKFPTGYALKRKHAL